MQCRKIDFSEQANKYVAHVISNGQSLSLRVLAVADVEKGTVSAIVPNHVDCRRLQTLSWEEFRYGGVLDYREGRACIAGFLRDLLLDKKNRICIFENAQARPDDAWLNTAKSRHLEFGEEVYHVPTGNGPKCIEEALTDAESSWMLAGFVARNLDVQDWLIKKSLHDRDIQSLAENVEYIVVSAFDGEGFLIWQSHEQILSDYSPRPVSWP